ncbi:MAG: DNA polymerase I [Atopobiaceae bacterium]|jgi:DNA polymerase-1|nr:DNA polymerase I [Atopobiaceae bacterium]MCH4180979.1 DNA polymerase I [Atopobiaceae bacterium]MCH4214414.1 DNA polymerase I [Atopobiaceae bacterium]MCH4229344.1 DNA polymerase I [Atopobiaceae bacterium]MCH4276698.1 DNA polymerase I [Atopobiaceae bacterium]
MAQAPQRTIAIVDGNSLMHRAFHAIPPTMTAPDGRATNALFGFTSMFVKMVESLSPDGVICCFDKGKPRVRMEMLPQYKAQRPPMDPVLHEQFPMVKDLLRAMDVPVVELEGWEGDDLLGTLARQGEEAGYDMLLVTGDRDMYQLSTDHVKVIGTRKGLSDVAVMDPASVEDLYHGITPALVPDFYGLKGDSSDNIPGVPGIGPKKAAALIGEYGSLDEVIAHADEVKGKMGENLRAHVDDALLSRKVATIRCDAPIDVDLATAEFPTFDADTVRAAFSDLGFTSLTARVLALAGGEGAGAAVAAATVDLGDPLVGEAAATMVAKAVSEGEWVGCAADDGAEAGTLFGLGHELWVSCEGGLAHLSGDDADKALVDLLAHGNVAAVDAKALIHAVYPVDSAVDAALDLADVAPERLFDVAVAAYLLDSSNGDYTAEAVAERYGALLPAASDELPAAALSAACARLVRAQLAGLLDSDGSLACFRDIEMPLVPVLARMERLGMYVDPSILASQSAELGADVATSAAAIHEAAGEDFNIDSPQQLSHVLFDVLGLPTAGLKKTKKGFYSTNAKVLSELAQTSPVVASVLDYREKTKIKSTYLDALPNLIAADGRVHTSFNQTVAATGRLSSSNPNLQNIPVRSDLGRRVRAAFTVPDGCVFLACDYSQIELRLLAHLSGDEHLIAAFCEGADFHAATAARVFGIPVAEVTPALRSRAKAVNFGIVYGQQAYGLSQSLHIPMGEAQQMIDRYFEAYPGVRTYLDRTVADAKATGYATTMYGRKRHVPDIHARNAAVRSFGERTAMNHPMQGTAADIIKVAMAEVERALDDEGLSSRLILQIHDELDLEVPQAEIEEVSELVRSTMEGVTELKVPLLAEVSYGETWADAK